MERSGRAAEPQNQPRPPQPLLSLHAWEAQQPTPDRPVCTSDWQGPSRICQPISQTRIKAPSTETAAAAQQGLLEPQAGPKGLLATQRATQGPTQCCSHPPAPPTPTLRCRPAHSLATQRSLPSEPLPLPEISLAICRPDAILRLRSHRLPAGLHADLPGGAHLESANPTLGSPVSCGGGGPAPCTSPGSSNLPCPCSALHTGPQHCRPPGGTSGSRSTSICRHKHIVATKSFTASLLGCS